MVALCFCRDHGGRNCGGCPDTFTLPRTLPHGCSRAAPNQFQYWGDWARDITLQEPIEFRMTLQQTTSVGRTALELEKQAENSKSRINRDFRLLLSQNVPFASYPFLKMGQQVRIRGGSLEGVEGVIVGGSGNRKLVVSVGLIGRSIAVTVEGCDKTVATAITNTGVTTFLPLVTETHRWSDRRSTRGNTWISEFLSWVWWSVS